MTNRVKELSMAAVNTLSLNLATHEETLAVGTVLIRYICDRHGLSVKETVAAFEKALEALESSREQTNG